MAVNEACMSEDQSTWEMVHRGLYAKRFPHFIAVLKLDVSELRPVYVLMVRLKDGIAYTSLFNYYIGEGEDLMSANFQRWPCPGNEPSRAIQDSASKVLELLGYTD